MGIQFSCSCGKLQRVSSKYVGHNAQCGHCGTDFQIPANSSSRGGGTKKKSKGKSKQNAVAFLQGAAGEQGTSSGIPDEPTKKASRPMATTNQKLLHPTGKKRTLICRPIEAEVKKLPGTEFVHSEVYSVGEKKGLQITIGWDNAFGSTKIDDLDVDRVEVFHLRDRFGDFAVIAPFNGIFPCPLEYVALMDGCLPDPIVLLKNSPDRKMELASAIGGPLGMFVSRMGANVETLWAACDGTDSAVANALQGKPDLAKGVLWDGKLGMADQEVFYHLRWGVQAIPVGDANYFLVAQTVPKKKIIGLNFNVAWFSEYRKQFSKTIASFGATEGGEFTYVDPGTWLATSVEALDWIDL